MLWRQQQNERQREMKKPLVAAALIVMSIG
jgi:hypothetical protein